MIPLILAAVFSSLLYVFSFAPWSFFHPLLSSLQWFAFVPLLYFLPKRNLNFKQTFGIGFVMSLGITVGGFYWIIYATQQYGGLPFLAAFALFLLFCLIAQLQVPIYLVIRKKVLDYLSPKLWVWISGLVYAGVESFYPKLFLDSAGHAFSGSLIFSQLADLGGVYFLTAVVITFSEAVVYTLRREFRFIWAPVTIFVLSFGYGLYRVNQIETLMEAQKKTPALHVAMVQANIGDYMKIAAERGLNGASDQVMNEFLKFSGQGIQESMQANGMSPDAIVWPETAYPALFGKPMRTDESRMESMLRNFAQNYPGMMIFGGYDQDEAGLDYNSLFFLPSSDAATNVRVPTYHKNILLMFGETLPFADFFPSMKSWFPTMGFFGRGPGPQVYTVPNVMGNTFKLAPTICYEGLFPDFSSTGALLGADAMINVTNDSWFGPNGEPYLHFALTRFRTIETRLPMLRSTNTGITAVIDPLGRIEGKTGLFEATVLHGTVHPRLDLVSPYLAMAKLFGGKWFERLVQTLALVLLGFLWMKRKTPPSIPVIRH